MLSKIKSLIIQLAKNAVQKVENELGSATGTLKKEKAINYIIENLPFPLLVKKIVALLLSEFIDNSVEAAVKYMNSLQK